MFAGAALCPWWQRYWGYRRGWWTSPSMGGAGARWDEGVQAITSALPPGVRLGRTPLGNRGWFHFILKGTWQVKWISSLYRGETGPEQGRGEWAGPGLGRVRGALTRTHGGSHSELGRAGLSPCMLSPERAPQGSVSSAEPRCGREPQAPRSSLLALGHGRWAAEAAALSERLRGGTAPAQHPGQRLTLVLARAHFGFSWWSPF